MYIFSTLFHHPRSLQSLIVPRKSNGYCNRIGSLASSSIAKDTQICKVDSVQTRMALQASQNLSDLLASHESSLSDLTLGKHRCARHDKLTHPLVFQHNSQDPEVSMEDTKSPYLSPNYQFPGKTSPIGLQPQ